MVRKWMKYRGLIENKKVNIPAAGNFSVLQVQFLIRESGSDL